MHATASRDPRLRSVGSKGFLATTRHPPPPYRYSNLKVSCTPTINEPSRCVIGDLGHRRWYCSSPSFHGTSSNTQDERPPAVGIAGFDNWEGGGLRPDDALGEGREVN
jgi:hypothetical protein